MSFNGVPHWAIRTAAIVVIATNCLWASQSSGSESPDGYRITDSAVFAFGGDVGLGRRMNGYIAQKGPRWPLQDIEIFNRADIAMVNLETAVGYLGEAGIDKGERGPYYYRTRTENLDVFYHAGIGVVGTANNHAMDYGAKALLDGNRHLDSMGIAHPGSGANRDEACSPVYRRAEGLSVAIFSADATMRHYRAGADQPGTCYLSLSDPDAWAEEFSTRISDARTKAHVVLIAVHWGPNGTQAPIDSIKGLAKSLVEIGFDAVLGSSAHVLHGLGSHRGRPIIYDAGNLLFDFTTTGKRADSAIFSLVLAPWGVRQVWIDPLHVFRAGRASLLTGNDAQEVLDKFIAGSARLGTRVVQRGTRALLELPPRPITSPAAPTPLPDHVVLRQAPKPPIDAPHVCTVDSPPDTAIRVDRKLGPLTLVAFDLPQQVLNGRSLLWLNTYWRIDAPVSNDLWFKLRVYPDDRSQSIWKDQHEPCDWAWPTSRWKPGVLYRDHYAIRPPAKVAPGPLEIRLGLSDATGATLVKSILLANAFVDPHDAQKRSK